MNCFVFVDVNMAFQHAARNVLFEDESLLQKFQFTVKAQQQQHKRRAGLCVFVVVVFTHSFTHSLIHSFTHSLIHSFTHSLIHSFTHSLIHSFTHSLIHSFVCFTHMCMHTCGNKFFTSRNIQMNLISKIDLNS